MKNLFLLLGIFLISPILLAQESTPNPESQPEQHTYAFDERCTAAIKWSASLMFARRSGTQIEHVLAEMGYRYQYGSLRYVPQETIDYMLAIIMTVYSHSSIETKEGALKVFRTVEHLCVNFLERPEKERKEKIEPIFTLIHK